MRMVIDFYRKKFREEAREIDLDEYFNMASPGGLEYLDELAVKGYEGMMHVEQLEDIQHKINDKEYLPISINIDRCFCGKRKMPTYFVFQEEEHGKIHPVPYG